MSLNRKKPLDGIEIEPPYNDADLEKVASRQLKPYPLPPNYLDHLRQHLDFFPHDYLFQLIPRAGQGYGLVKCLEPGCSTIPVSLAQNATDPDGGRSTGFGTLAQFQAHIITDEFHETLRDRRLSRKQARNSSSKNEETPDLPQMSSCPVDLDLCTSSDYDVKPSRLSSAAIATSVSSKRVLESPSVYRETKESRIQQDTYHLEESAKPTIIDVDSFNSKNPKNITKQKPIFIDLDSSEPEICVLPYPKSRQTQAAWPVDDDTAVGSISDEDEDTICVAGEGSVPLSRFAKPQLSTRPAPQSWLSTQVSAASRFTTLDTKPQTSSSTTDKQSLAQAFNITRDKAVPRNDSRLTTSSLFMDLEAFPGQRSHLSRVVAGLSANTFNYPRSATTRPAYDLFEGTHTLTGFPNYNQRRSQASGSAWAQSSGLLDWHPAAYPNQSLWQMQEGSLHNRPSDPAGMYDSIFSQLADGFPLNRPALNTNPPRAEPQMRPEELQDFYKRAVENIDFANNTTVAEARKALDISEDEDARMDGLAIRLMPHQLIAVSWMVTQEKSKNSGGILADEMGLGKTIQMIATMVKNSSSDPKKKATLVLAPLALLTQWKEEIVDKSSRKWKVMIYHQSFTKAAERKKIAGNDIVITTLDTLRHEWNGDATGTTSKKSGGLFSVEWYRVVIDEAQIIRNRTAKKSAAVCALKSTYRWCLTGTPIFNTLWDLYPYLRFLRIRPYNEVEEFRRHIAKHEKKSPNLATQRAQAVLATCLLRRQKDSKLDGQPLVVLPPKKIEDIILDLSPDERDVYNMLEKQAQRKFNVFLKKGTVLKNFACILVLLLRLRQACGHPSLTIEEGQSGTGDGVFSSDPISELERAVDTLGQTWVDNIKKKFQTETEELAEAEKEDSSQAAAPECPICNDLLDDTSRVTKCGHVFCQGCIETLLAHPDPLMDEARTNDPNSLTKPCPNCRSPFRSIDTYLKKAFLPSSNDLEDENETLPAVRRKMRNGVVDDSDDEKPSSSKAKPSKKGKEKATTLATEPELVPSTKMVWLLEEIIRVLQEFPTDKTIVISQWTAMLSLCADFLHARGYRYVEYNGSMNGVERDEAVSNFRKRENVPIMLMSLKCGGVGLNLTCANRVISLDLAWSPASERQAFDRTHRLGQIKEVFVKRLITQNTVEQRICELQLKKQNITDHALGEGSGKKLQRITVGELANLFNLNVHGEALS